MQTGIIGMGRIGANIAIRLLKAGHECVVYSRRAESIEKLVNEGAKGSTDLGEFADKLMSAMRHEFGGHHEKKAGGQS